MAFQTKDVLNAMIVDSQLYLIKLHVDGGAVQNNFLMQFQADILDVEIIRPVIQESTALGAALFAGLAIAFYSEEEIQKNQNVDRVFKPSMKEKDRQNYYREWLKAIKKVRS